MKRRPRPLRYVSALTLAFFADSGWYGANWTALAASRPPAWGYGGGCAFAEQPCLAADGTDAPPPAAHPFCNGDASDRTGGGYDGCSADHLALAYCNRATYTGALAADYQARAGAPLRRHPPPLPRARSE